VTAQLAAADLASMAPTEVVEALGAGRLDHLLGRVGARDLYLRHLLKSRQHVLLNVAAGVLHSRNGASTQRDRTASETDPEATHRSDIMAAQHIWRPTNGPRTVTLTEWILPVLLLTIRVPSWWRGTRRFRLWFALLAPVACVAGVVLALIGVQRPGRRLVLPVLRRERRAAVGRQC
jgi:hypothetical protein